MPHPQLLQRVDERGPRQHGEVGQAPPRGVARQQLRDAAVAAGRLEQRGQVDAGQDEVELRAGVASRQDLEDAGALAGEAAANAGEGLGGGQGDSAVPRDRRGGSVERRGLALGLGAAAREDAAAAMTAAAASSSLPWTPGTFPDGEAGQVDRFLDLVLDVGRGDDLVCFLKPVEVELRFFPFSSSRASQSSERVEFASSSFSFSFLSLSPALYFLSLTADSTSHAISILAAASARAAAPAAAVRAQ